MNFGRLYFLLYKFIVCLLMLYIQGRPKKVSHFVLQQDLAQVNNISFLTLICNVFETTLENKVGPSSE